MEADDRPNVIWIVLDACRAGNLSCYGYERPTSPAIDSIAARGVVFEQHYAQYLFTSPSVASYMSGRYFPVSCLWTSDWPDRFRVPAEDETLLPHIMGENGYETFLVSGSPWFESDSRLCIAFDRIEVVAPDDPKLGYSPFEELNACVFPWLEQARTKPFFLYIHALDTHFPHFLSPPYDRWLPEDMSGTDAAAINLLRVGWPRGPKAPPFSDREKEYLRGLHDGSILYADDHIGHLVSRLDELGLAENTIIIISADHGDVLGEDGRSTQHAAIGQPSDEVMQVPLIVAGGGLPAGRRVTALTENVDIVPTLVDLLNLRTPARFDGQSLVGVTGDSSDTDQAVFAIARWRYEGNDHRFTYVLRDADYKYLWDPVSGDDSLWSAPDRLAHRTPVLEGHREIARRMHARIRDEYAPLYDVWKVLGFRPPDKVFEMSLPATNHPRCEWLCDADWRRLSITRMPSANEGAVRLDFTVPDSTYGLSVSVSPGSSFLVKAEGDAAFRPIADPRKDEAGHFATIEIGTYAVTDGTFTIHVERGERNRPAIMDRLFFTPPSALDTGAESIAEDEARMERLRTLGYVD
ncbi:MAG: sulfatase [bacterium]|nr:sulfatase [bacterium]